MLNKCFNVFSLKWFNCEENIIKVALNCSLSRWSLRYVSAQQGNNWRQRLNGEKNFIYVLQNHVEVINNERMEIKTY